ncbi:hypothetical protein ES703_53083 [subsurface metagenome]
MKLDRAIENLKRGRKDAGMIPEDEYTQTLDLASEALKRIRQFRNRRGVSMIAPLKGETKE